MVGDDKVQLIHQLLVDHHTMNKWISRNIVLLIQRLVVDHLTKKKWISKKNNAQLIKNYLLIINIKTSGSIMIKFS